MPHLHMGAVLQHLRRAAARQQDDELSDEQLLERFAQRRDEAAFAALLRRHGPMVLGVCRSILRQIHDVEDAFQATFLILAQKAGCIRRGSSVGGWLHEVAYNVSLKAQTSALRREACVRRMPNIVEADPLDELTVRELRQALHDELRQLPEKYRLPLILCYLEGKTQEEAARQLAWPRRRVKDRLQRGREQLRRRLQRRGLAPAAALGTALFAADEVSAAAPAVLTAATLRSAVQATPLTPSITALVKTGGTLESTSKIKMTMVFLLFVATSGSLVGWLGRASGPLAATLPPPAAKAESKEPTPPKPETAKTLEIHGRVLGPDGKPKAEAKILLLGPLDSIEQQELLLEGGKVRQLAVSGMDGRFTVTVTKPKRSMQNYLVAQCANAGFDFFDVNNLKPENTVEFRLVKDHVIRGRIVNTEGKPAAGVRVAVNRLHTYPNNSLDSFLIFWKNRPFNSGERGEAKSIWSGAGAVLSATTDAAGRFALHGVGEERFLTLLFSGGGIAANQMWVVNRAGFDPKPYNQATHDNLPKGERGFNNRWMLSGPDVSVIVEPEKIIRGKVTEADTGKVRPGVVVRLTRRNGGDDQNSGNYLDLKVGARTDTQGRYEIHGTHKAKSYLVQVESDVAAGYLGRGVWAADTLGYRPVTADIRVRKGVIVTGKMIEKTTGKPLDGYVSIVDLSDNPFVKEYSDGTVANLFIWCLDFRHTDANGVFRAVTIPGPVLLMGTPTGRGMFKSRIPDPDYPQYFTKRGGFYNYSGSGTTIVQGNFCKVLQIKRDAAVVNQDIVLERQNVLGVVKIRDAKGQPLSDVVALAWANRIDGDSCTIYGEETDQPRFLAFYNAKRKLAGTLTVKAGEKLPPVVKLKPMGSVKGRLLDADGKPLEGIVVDPDYREGAANGMQYYVHEGQPIASDANGVFTLDCLIADLPLELTFRKGRGIFERIVKAPESVISVKAGECREVGSIQLKPVPEKVEK